MKAQHSKLTGCTKSSTKREVSSNTILWQETRKISNKQPNLKSETIRERRTKIKFKISRRKEIIKSEKINEIETKKTITKSMKLKAGSLKKQMILVNL